MSQVFPPVVSIRYAGSEDLIRVLRVQIDALRTLCVSDYTPQQIEALIERNIRHSSFGGSRNEITLVAEVDGVVGGCATLMGYRITAIYVHPQFARKGIGTQLLVGLEQMAMNNRVNTLRVAASFNAKSFYQANGYQLVSQSHFLTNEGLQIPYLNMRKHL
ncbi:MAG: GNAT family N-acetyltransferase [Microcoleaceae cyanobacterium]